MLSKARLKEVLESLRLADPKIDVWESTGIRLMAEVISPSFAEMDEGDRQALVLGKILDDLSDKESRQVEFVFTYAPGELEEAEARALESRP